MDHNLQNLNLIFRKYWRQILFITRVNNMLTHISINQQLRDIHNIWHSQSRWHLSRERITSSSQNTQHVLMYDFQLGAWFSIRHLVAIGFGAWNVFIPIGFSRIYVFLLSFVDVPLYIETGSSHTFQLSIRILSHPLSEWPVIA